MKGVAAVITLGIIDISIMFYYFITSKSPSQAIIGFTQDIEAVQRQYTCNALIHFFRTYYTTLKTTSNNLYNLLKSKAININTKDYYCESYSISIAQAQFATLIIDLDKLATSTFGKRKNPKNTAIIDPIDLEAYITKDKQDKLKRLLTPEQTIKNLTTRLNDLECVIKTMKLYTRNIIQHRYFLTVFANTTQLLYCIVDRNAFEDDADITFDLKDVVNWQLGNRAALVYMNKFDSKCDIVDANPMLNCSGVSMMAQADKIEFALVDECCCDRWWLIDWLCRTYD